MDLEKLRDVPPWEWPEGIEGVFLEILRNDRSGESDRLLAVEMAGEYTVISDELADALLSIVLGDDEAEALRARAVISLGPALELADTEGFEDPEDILITEGTSLRIQDSLRRLYTDTGVPEEVRRRVLEASVRAPQDWHRDAIRGAYASDQEDWRLTAVFCMRFVKGFEDQILEALESENPDILYEAVNAAGSWELDTAWPRLTALLASEGTDKDVLLAAIEAVTDIRPHETGVILADLADSEDEDIAEAAGEAMIIAETFSGDIDVD
jgi:hypothetical protein